MNTAILLPTVQGFIQQHLKGDRSKLLFKGTNFAKVSTQEIVEQLEAKKKSELKLPTWFKTANIYYPNKLNIEQTSSEITAAYKASLVTGESLIDLTGGFGVDSFYFAKHFEHVTHCEINSNLSEIVTHNLKEFGIQNVATIQGDGIKYLQKNNNNYDCIYVDPSRRNDVKAKVFLLKDCLPNIPENLDVLFQHTDKILIKTSPILDVKSAIRELNFTKEVHIVAVKNEVKELLFLLEKEFLGTIEVKTINNTIKCSQNFDFKHNTNITSTYSLPKKYIYEPNAAILKSGGFNEITQQYNVSKLQQHSHLYTSDVLIDFPGRIFKMKNNISPGRKLLKKLIPEGKANITTRNFPQTVAEIRKKTKLKDGGSNYLFFTTDCNDKHVVLVCEKV